MRSSPLHPWFSIDDSKSPAMMPYPSTTSTYHLRHHYHRSHHYQQASPWLSSIVEHRPPAFAQHQDPSQSALQSQNSELDCRLFTQLSPRDRHQGDFADLREGKTQSHDSQGTAAGDTRRNANKTSISGMVML